MTTRRKTTKSTATSSQAKPVAEVLSDIDTTPMGRPMTDMEQLMERVDELEARLTAMEKDHPMTMGRFMLALGSSFSHQGQTLVDSIYPPSYEIKLVDDEEVLENQHTLRVIVEKNNTLTVMGRREDNSWAPLEPNTYAHLPIMEEMKRLECEVERPYRVNVIKSATNVR